MAAARSEGFGRSHDMHLAEALRNAISDLNPTSEHPDQQHRVKVVEVGVEVGGIAGGESLYVKVELVD